MTFCMNVSRFMNLAAIFSLDLESQFMTSPQKFKVAQTVRVWMGSVEIQVIYST